MIVWRNLLVPFSRVLRVHQERDGNGGRYRVVFVCYLVFGVCVCKLEQRP